MNNKSRRTATVAVLGAAAVDVVIRVKDFPSPDGIVMADEQQSHPGGSGGNVAEGVARLGYPVRFLGVVGNDENGRLLQHTFSTSGVDTSFIKVSDSGHTASCFIAVNQKGERLIFSLGGEAIYSQPGELDPSALENIKVLYIADAFPEVALCAIMKAGTGVKIIYCPGGLMVKSGKAFYEPVMKRAHVGIFNQVEAQAITGMVEPENALVQLAEMGVQVPIITHGALGALYYEDGHCFQVPAAPAASVVDTTGAGDAFSAGMIAGMLEGLEMSASVALACEVAAFNVQHQGARDGMPYRRQVASLASREIS